MTGCSAAPTPSSCCARSSVISNHSAFARVAAQRAHGAGSGLDCGGSFLRPSRASNRLATQRPLIRSDRRSIRNRRRGNAVFNDQSSLARWVFVFSCCVHLGFSGDPAEAESPSEKPLAFASGDARLEWGPCPPLFPKGCEIAVLHGEPSKPNADVFLKVPANYAIPPHWHTSPERMVLVSGKLQVQYDGHSPSILEPGTYAYGPAKAPHKASCTGSGPCVLFIAFESPIDAHPPGGSPK